MKIIDFQKKGNIVRFFLGDSNLQRWHGDDWDSVSYENNAGRVYDKFVSGYKDVAFGFDDIVFEPSNGGWSNSGYCKNDMVERRVPCICVLKKEHQHEGAWYGGFKDITCDANVIAFYFGDEMEA